jgi:hypothetical protein
LPRSTEEGIHLVVGGGQGIRGEDLEGVQEGAERGGA